MQILCGLSLVLFVSFAGAKELHLTEIADTDPFCEGLTTAVSSINSQLEPQGGGYAVEVTCQIVKKGSWWNRSFADGEARIDYKSNIEPAECDYPTYSIVRLDMSWNPPEKLTRDGFSQEVEVYGALGFEVLAFSTDYNSSIYNSSTKGHRTNEIKQIQGRNILLLGLPICPAPIDTVLAESTDSGS